jgi:multiple sugar transport system permease protein
MSPSLSRPDVPWRRTHATHTLGHRDGGDWTIPVASGQFRQASGFITNWPALMAVVVLATLPIVVSYVFCQRYFVEGVAAAGVKR